MNKRNLIIGIVVLVALVGGVVLWNGKNNQQDTKQQTNKEVVKQTQEQKIAKEGKEKGEEKNIEKSETNKKNNVKNVKPKFGIDDSQLKYNEDGSIDTSAWKTSDMLIKFKYPESWHKVDLGISNAKNLKDNLDAKQIYIQGTGFGAPFDIDEASGKNIDELLVNAVKHSVDSTEKYVKKYNGTCQKNAVDKYNVYMKCKYKKNNKMNILFERTFIYYKIDGSDKKTGGNAGLNIEFGDLKTLENNKKVINEILKSAHIERILGENSFTLDGMYLK